MKFYTKNVLDKNSINNENVDNNVNIVVPSKNLVETSRMIPEDNEKIEIYYTLDGKEEVMFIFYVDELLVIQVGLSDEGPKFIAYE